MRRPLGFGFRHAHVEREVDDELAFHLEMRARKLASAGLPTDDARREALRQFGDVGTVRQFCIDLDRERIRTMERVNLLSELRQDLVYAARMLRRNAGVTAVIVLTLGLGIGANTAIFTLVNAVLLRKLPVRAPDELIALGDPSRVGGMSFTTSPRGDMFSYATYKALRADTALVSGLLASGRVDRLDVLADSAATEALHPHGRLVSGNYFSVLGVPAYRGRVFDGSEDVSVGASPVATISYDYWQRRFGGDEHVVGRDVLINGSRFTIIGVTPPGFTGEIVGRDTDIWLPLTMQGVLYPNRRMLDQTEAYWLLLLGRRQPGVTEAQAEAGFATHVRRILAQQASNAVVAAGVKDVRLWTGPGARGLSNVRRSYEAPLITLMIGVAVLLLIICANVGNLLLARAVARTREMSVRLAIGAGRGRLVRQLLTEGLLLALAGGAAGLVVAHWGSRFLLWLVADGGGQIPLDVRLDVPVLVFTLGLSVLAVGLFALAPALRASRVDVASTLRASARSLSGSEVGARGQRVPLGRMLIAAQVALSMVLLVGAALLVRSLESVQGTDTGLDRDHLLIVDLDANSRGYAGDRLTGLARDLGAAFERIPGVTAVSWSENGLFSGTESASNVGIPGYVPRQEDDSTAYYDEAGPGFVGATGMRLLAGRDLAATDDAHAPTVVLINASFATFYFGKANPVGQTIRLSDSTYAEVVGVVADVRDHDLTVPAVRRYYVAYQQHPFEDPGALRFIVRASGDPARLNAPVRRVVAAHDPQLPIDGVDALSFLMRRSVREERLLARLATGFGALALLLAAVGLYGVMTYAVTRRTGEIGLRVALGAQRNAVVGMVVRDALRLVAVGIVIGVPLALAATKLLRNQLYGVQPSDPASIAVALVVLLASAVVASLLPAMRASRVAPVVALREE